MTTRMPIQCMACTRFRKATIDCEAFPGGIPAAIAHGGDHQQRVGGDHGLRFKQASGPEAQKAFDAWKRVFGA